MLFSNEPTNIDNIQLKIGRDKLTLTTNYNFLGIKLDNKLEFNNHIKSIVCKVAKSNGTFYRNCKFLNIEAGIDFYYEFVYSYFSYNVLIGGNLHENTLKPLVNVQKGVLRCIAHTSLFLKKYRLLKFRDIVEYVLCIHICINKSRRINTVLNGDQIQET